MANELRGIKPLEISLVDRGANKRRILVRKRDDGGDVSESSIEKQDEEGMEKATRLGDRLAALRDEKELTNEDLADAAGIEVSTMQGIISGEIARPPDERLRGLARLLDVSFDSLLDLIPEDIQQQDSDMPVTKIEFTEDQKAALAAFQAGEADDEQMAMVNSILSAASEFGGLYPKPDAVEQQDDEEEVEMQDDEEEDIEMSKRDEQHAEELRKRDERIEALEKQATEERNLRLEREHIAKAAKWDRLVKADDAGPILKSIADKVSDDEFAWIEKRLDEAQAIAKQSDLFAETGTTGTGEDSDNPVDRLETIAKRLVAEGQAPNIFKARVLAQEQNRELVNEIHNREV